MCYVLITRKKKLGVTDITLSESIIALEMHRTELEIKQPINDKIWSHEIKEFEPKDMPYNFIYMQSEDIIAYDVKRAGSELTKEVSIAMAHYFSLREE